MIRRAARRTLGSARVLSLLASQRRIGHASPETFANQRDSRVRDVIRYAANSVPWYQDMFRQQRIDPRDIASATGLEQLPILDKGDVRVSPDAFRAQTLEGKRAIPFKTSGTTGEPLIVYHDPGSIVSNFAYCEPEKQVVAEILGRRRDIRQLAIISMPATLHRIWGVYRDWSFIPVPSEQSLVPVETSIGDAVDHINQARPTVLSGYGSYLETLFRYVAANDIKMHRPKLVSYAADAITDVGQELIRNEFGIPLISRYSSVESFRIGFTCPEYNGFHIRSDICHLRVVDENGQNVPAGHSGEIIISNLVNRGTVLLNYRLGDRGVISKSACPCGRPMPLLSELEGRAEDVVTLESGQTVHPRAIWRLIGGHSRVVRYQLIQREINRFELRLVTVDSSDFNDLAAQLSIELRQLLRGAQIDCVCLDSIPVPPGGKFRPVISLHSTEGRG